MVLQELLHLAASLIRPITDTSATTLRANIDNSTDLDARARKNAEPLAGAAGQKCIDRPHAEIERLADPLARMRGRRFRKV